MTMKKKIGLFGTILRMGVKGGKDGEVECSQDIL
jgi:hypothetical protein